MFRRKLNFYQTRFVWLARHKVTVYERYQFNSAQINNNNNNHWSRWDTSDPVSSPTALHWRGFPSLRAKEITPPA